MATLKKDRKLVFDTNYCLIQARSIAECSKGSILHYFASSLSYHLLLISLFCLFEWLLKTGFTVFLFLNPNMFWVIKTTISIWALIKIFVLSIFEWPFYTGFTVLVSVCFSRSSIPSSVWISKETDAGDQWNGFFLHQGRQNGSHNLSSDSQGIKSGQYKNYCVRDLFIT